MKRFTETSKWDDAWFLDLSLEAKLFWVYLCDKADNAGVVDLHPRKASFEIGTDAPIQGLLEELQSRLVLLPNGKYHIPGFIAFQFGHVLSDSNLHRSVRALCLSHGLPDTLEQPPNHTLPEGSQTPTSKGKGKGIGREEGESVREGETNHQQILNSIRTIINRTTGGQIQPQKLQVEYNKFMSYANGLGIPDEIVVATLAHTAADPSFRSADSGKQLEFKFYQLRRDLERQSSRHSSTDEEIENRYAAR